MLIIKEAYSPNNPASTEFNKLVHMFAADDAIFIDQKVSNDSITYIGIFNFKSGYMSHISKYVNNNAYNDNWDSDNEEYIKKTNYGINKITIDEDNNKIKISCQLNYDYEV